ncbi:MAG: anaerobic ribonucleoside-triphosphate reductase activating protein [Erysipelothrix sp.]|nr:anaerobic ribonucleoside-triphosphate reductase activating protein [Erysipelothrix sp.]
MIQGFQEISLVDYPGKVATIAFVQGCPLRCPYCHNPDLIPFTHLDNNEISTQFFDFIIKRRALIDGVVVSGGEPLSNSNIITLLKRIKSFNINVKLDTSGINAPILKEILQNDLVDYVALDFKNIPDLFDITCGIKQNKQKDVYIKNWLDSLRLLRSSLIQYELRTTVVKSFHSIQSLKEMTSFLFPDEHWYIQPYKKNNKNLNDTDWLECKTKLMSYSEMEFKKIIDTLKQYHTNTYLR